MAWPHGYQQASGKDTQDPTLDSQFDWTLPLDFVLEQRMDFAGNPQVTHGNGFESFDLNNYAASSAPYSFGDYSLPTQTSLPQQGTVDPAVLSQHNWPSSETASTSSSFDGHSSGFEKHSSTLSLGTYSTNSSSCSQTLEGDSFNSSKPNKRRFCERTMEDPAPATAQIQLVSPGNMLAMEADQNAISIFESWLSDCPSIYPEDSEFNDLAALTQLDVGVVKSWFVKRLRTHRMDDSTFDNWLDRYPSVYPGDEEFRSWAGLTKLSLDAVRLWFAQKLRCTASIPPSNEHSASGSHGIGAGATFATPPTSTAPTSQQPSILQRAAAWVREEKETKCEATLDRSLLLRDNHKPFQCTLKCGKKFRTRDDWRRHEEVNWPQEGWVCDLPASATVAGIRICTQCETPNPQVDHAEIHKKAACSDQPFPRGRLFHRKDHFSQHFRKVHPHVPWVDYERSSHFSVESNFPRRCGFCSHRFLLWKDRVEHIGFHFHDEGKDMTQWNDHSEREDESSNSDDRHDDDDDESPDEGSDSSDDDSDDSPPRSAPKKRVQARASRSGGHSSAIAPGSSNWTLQPSLDPLEPDVQPSPSIEDEDDPYDVSNDDDTMSEEVDASETQPEAIQEGNLKNNDLDIAAAPRTQRNHQFLMIRSLVDDDILHSSLQHSVRRPSLPYRQQPLPNLICDTQPTPPAYGVAKPFDGREKPQYVQSSSPRTTSEESEVHQVSSQSMHSDNIYTPPESKESAVSATRGISWFTAATTAVMVFLLAIPCVQELLQLGTKVSTYLDDQVDNVWRVISAFGAITTCIAVSYRLTIPETRPNESISKFYFNLVLPWWKSSDSKQSHNLKMNQTMGRIRSLLFLSFTLFLSLLTSCCIYAVTKLSIFPVLLPPAQLSSIWIADGSSFDGAQVAKGTYFSTAVSGILQTRIVYNGGNGQICIRTESQNEWSNLQCLDGANPRADTPLTVLDWLGGPSIYFITADNYLSGIDYMSSSDTWQFSTLRDMEVRTHPQSQLSSVTWLNGASAWLYYQDANNQSREFGVDDYQDVTWRDGNIGPLGLALPRTINRTSRWWLSDDENEALEKALEVYFQVNNAALHGRFYMESAWNLANTSALGTSNTTLVASVTPVPPATSTTTSGATSAIPLHSLAEENTELPISSNISANNSCPEMSNAYWIEHSSISGCTYLDFMKSDIRNWWDGFFQIHVARSYPESTTFNDTQHSFDKHVSVLLADANPPQRVIAWPDMTADGNGTLIPDLFQEDGRQDVSNTGSEIPRHPARPLISSQKDIRISNSTLFFWINFTVWSQILLVTYTTCVLDGALQNRLGREKLYDFELVVPIFSILICVYTLLHRDEKDTGSYIIPGCIFFVLVQVLISTVNSVGIWRRYASCLLIMTLPLLALLCSPDIVLCWVHPVTTWVLLALVLYLNISRESKLSQICNEETENSPGWTIICNTCRVIFHLLGNPIDFIWNLAIRTRNLSSAKAINASSEASIDAQLRLLYDHLQSRRKKSDHDQIGDNADERLILLKMSELESLLGIRPRNHFVLASRMCWYFNNLAYRGFDSIARASTRKINFSFEKLASSTFYPVQCCFYISCLAFLLLNQPKNILIKDGALFGIALGSTVSIGLGAVLIFEVRTRCLTSTAEHQSSAEDYLSSKMKKVPRDFDITRNSWREISFRKKEKSSKQRSKGIQSSGTDVSVASWGIDPLADVGAWAEGTTIADAYPSTLSGMDLSMEEKFGS